MRYQMKAINVDKLLAYLESQKQDCQKRLTWVTSERERGFEEGYARCLANLSFAISMATEG